MPNIKKECLKDAFDALKNFSKEELEEYANRVIIKAEGYDPLRGPEAIDRATQEVNDEKLKSYFNDAAQTAKNILAFERSAAPIRDRKMNLRGAIAGRRQTDKYSKTSKTDNYNRKINPVDSIKADYEKMIKVCVGRIYALGEISALEAGKIDSTAIDNFDNAKEVDALSQRFSQTIKNYLIESKSQLILSGAMKPEDFHPKRFFTQIHDEEKIISANRGSWVKRALSKGKVTLREGKVWWRNIIKKYADIPETFKYTKANEGNGVIIDGNGERKH